MTQSSGKAIALIAVAARNVRFWHKADMSGSGLVPRKLTPEPHFVDRKSLL